MKPVTKDWVEKAEGDFGTSGRELRNRKNPNYDAVCFHAQQSVEKYFKACLQEAEIAFSKTHDLVALLDLVLKVEPLWLEFRPMARALNTFAVDLRYPGESADLKIAKQAFKYCSVIRAGVRARLGLAV